MNLFYNYSLNYLFMEVQLTVNDEPNSIILACP